MDGFTYSTQTAEGFEAVYSLGHSFATEFYRASVLCGAPIVYPNQATLDAASLFAASQYREQQARVPNFTDDDQRFDAAWVAGYVVAILAEQDAYQNCPEDYRAELQQRVAAQLPAAQIIDSDCVPVGDEDE